MKRRTRWMILSAAAVLVLLALGFRWYLGTPGCRARWLVGELRNWKRGPSRPVRWLVDLGLMSDRRRSRKEIQTDLVALGEVAVPAVIRGFEDQDCEVRMQCVEVLRAIGLPALPALQQASADGNSLVRFHAAVALSQMLPAPEQFIGHFVEALTHQDRAARVLAAASLGEIGPAAAPAAPALGRALSDKDLPVRFNAAWALTKIGEGAREAVPFLVRALKDSDPGVRGCAALALRGIGPPAKPAVPALVRRLQDPDGRVRYWAADALIKIDLSFKQAEAVFTQALADEDPEVRQAAAGALTLIRARQRTQSTTREGPKQVPQKD